MKAPAVLMTTSFLFTHSAILRNVSKNSCVVMLIELMQFITPSAVPTASAAIMSPTIHTIFVIEKAMPSTSPPRPATTQLGTNATILPSR